MGHIEAPAWWADVQHLRDVHERTDEARRLAEAAETRATRERGTASGAVVERRHEDRDRRPRDVEIVAPLPPRRGPHVKGSPVPARRTIEIRGRTVPAPTIPRASVELDRRRPSRRGAIERVGPRPDRLAMWALFMGLLLILVAVGTADASVLS